MDCSLPGSFVRGILQATILESLPFASPGELLDTEMEPTPPVVPALQLLSLSTVLFYTQISAILYPM